MNHIKIEKHKQADLHNCSREKIANMAEAEELFPDTQASHYHRFRSMDCTTEIIKRLYDKRFRDYRVFGFWPSSGILKSSKNVTGKFPVIMSVVHHRQNVS